MWKSRYTYVTGMALAAALAFGVSGCADKGASDTAKSASAAAESAKAQASSAASGVNDALKAAEKAREKARKEAKSIGSGASDSDRPAMDEASVKGVLAKFATAIGTENPQLVKLNFVLDKDGSEPKISTVVAEAIDPAKPEELNEWTWSYTSGNVEQSATIDYDNDVEALKANLFAMNDVTPAVIAGVPQTVLDAAKVEGGKVGGVIISRLLMAAGDNSIVIQSSADGPRSHKTVRLDATGKVTKIL